MAHSSKEYMREYMREYRKKEDVTGYMREYRERKKAEYKRLQTENKTLKKLVNSLVKHIDS